MSDAWADYFAGPVPPAEGGVNWAAYSHDELYQMLWQDADVGDVSTVATEWAKHHAALTTHAEVLREQATALRDCWHGAGADKAAGRLEALAARVDKISEFAGAGAQAAQDAANALATARAMMPAPPGKPAVPMADATSVPGAAQLSEVVVPTAPSSSMASMASYMSSMQNYLASMQSSFSSMASMPMSATPAVPDYTVPDYTATMAPASTTTPSSTTTLSSAAPSMSGAFGAVGGAGFSFYSGSAAIDQQKAQAVRAMQGYESSLTASSQLINDARSAVPAAAPLPQGTGSASPAPEAAGAHEPVPWQRLVGSGPTGDLQPGPGVGAVVGGPGAVRGAPYGSGIRVGAVPGLGASPGAQAAPLAETPVARATGQGGMVPPVGGQRGAGADDEAHENRMPTPDHGLFAVEAEISLDVIGLTGEQR